MTTGSWADSASLTEAPVSNTSQDGSVRAFQVRPGQPLMFTSAHPDSLTLDFVDHKGQVPDRLGLKVCMSSPGILAQWFRQERAVTDQTLLTACPAQATGSNLISLMANAWDDSLLAGVPDHPGLPPATDQANHAPPPREQAPFHLPVPPSDSWQPGLSHAVLPASDPGAPSVTPSMPALPPPARSNAACLVGLVNQSQAPWRVMSTAQSWTETSVRVCAAQTGSNFSIASSEILDSPDGLIRLYEVLPGQLLWVTPLHPEEFELGFVDQNGQVPHRLKLQVSWTPTGILARWNHKGQEVTDHALLAACPARAITPNLISLEANGWGGIMGWTYTRPDASAPRADGQSVHPDELMSPPA